MLALYKKNPLFFILLFSFIFRSIAAFYNYTPMGEDDYRNVIGPALEYLQRGEMPQITEIRFPIFPRLFWLLFFPSKWFSITDVRFIVSWGFFLMGLFSLIGIYAIYKITEKVAPGKENLVGWLYGAHYLLPLYSTRTFQESFTLTTVPLALYFLYREKRKYDFFWGGFLLGVTSIIRHQAIILPFIFTVAYIYETVRKKREKLTLALYLLGGFLAFLLLLLLDISEGRKPLSTPLAYFEYNFASNVKSTEFGVYPWYNYFLVLLAVFIPPFSLGLLPAFIRGCQKLKLWAFLVFFFVLVHNLIANKMERFLLPILPLFLILTAKGLDLEKVYEKISLRGFWVINFILLIPILFSRSQLNIIDAARFLRNSPYRVVLYKVELWKQGYLGYEKPFPLSIDQGEDKLIEVLLQEKEKKYHVLTLGPLERNTLEKISQKEFTCSLEKTFEPSWQEQIIIYFNPGPNKRRDTTYLYFCQK